jgi:competence protein ComEC
MKMPRSHLCSFAFLFILATSAAASGESLTVYFTDVGKGGATLLHQPGKCAMLVDAGPAESSEELLTVLDQAEVKVLDFVVVTHPHKGNFGGLPSVSKKVKIRELSDNGDMNEEEKGFDAYSKLQFNLPYSVLAKGDSWRCGDMGIEVVHPSASYDSGENYNSRSLALMINYNSFRLLLLGGVSDSGEKKLLRSKEDLQAMVLQIGSNGTDSATIHELLERVDPKIAIVSVGNSESIEVQAQEVLKGLGEKNVRIFRTDQEGTIQLRVAENGNIRVKP